jgi:uncharacterized protein (DUF3084 family)
MNLEQFLFGSVLCAGIGILAGVLGNWWSNRDDVKQMEDWQTELVDRELDAQEQLIQAQRERNEAQLLRESARDHHEQTKQLVRQMRQELHQAAYEAIEFNDEMADTLLTLVPVVDGDIADTVVR